MVHRLVHRGSRYSTRSFQAASFRPALSMLTQSGLRRNRLTVDSPLTAAMTTEQFTSFAARSPTSRSPSRMPGISHEVTIDQHDDSRGLALNQVPRRVERHQAIPLPARGIGYFTR